MASQAVFAEIFGSFQLFCHSRSAKAALVAVFLLLGPSEGLR